MLKRIKNSIKKSLLIIIKFFLNNFIESHHIRKCVVNVECCRK